MSLKISNGLTVVGHLAALSANDDQFETAF